MEAVFNIIYNFMGILFPFDWLSHDFMKRALLATLFVAPAAAAMGIHVVNFRMSFYSDAISHSAFTGVALGILAGIDPVVTMVFFGLFVGSIIVKVRKKTDLSVDTIIGVAFSTSVALGIVIISAKRGLTRNLHSFIYGDVLAVSEGEIVLMALLALAVLLFAVYLYNHLILMAINGEVAKTKGVPTTLYEYIFSILLALVVCLCIRVVGILLVTALIIVPAAVGRILSKNVASLFWYSMAAALLASVTGLVISYYWDTATGATMVLVCAVLFFLSQVIAIFQKS
ncbi:MAG: metal ABC transporter permease [Deltaproteobacteria bacterium]|nr:metal ABC transporter permease [Deltaproteobacteria bacterium]